MELIFNSQIDKIIELALTEDIGSGDITTLSTIPAGTSAHGRFIAKQDTVICGIDIAKKVFCIIDPKTVFTSHFSDGDKVTCGDVIAEVSGDARAMLTAERTALNIMQRLSGVATRTAQCVDMVSGTKAKIADTRKTTPGMRALEKYAVRVGGGTNHRFNLADGVLIKDNHIAAAGSITAAVQNSRRMIPHTLKIEVEVETFEQLNEAIDAGADIIMLDNMSNEDMAKCVEITAGRALLEASGNMDQRDLRKVAETGVDIISIGALTHTIKAADISLKFSLNK
ncbi:MAG: carboxylating nicotinate-nucleotide diphosphorylase [Clostridia bacterium]|nr:carboxylating nicotinate-nucleotide diphosphorylase [Clostridia bacterium]